MLAQLELLFVNLYKILDLTQLYKTPGKVYGSLFHHSSQKGSQCPEAPGCRDMGTLPGHAEFLPCSHPYFPSISTDIAISALSIKLHNKLLSKITLERNLILDSTYSCNICMKQVSRELATPSLTLPLCPGTGDCQGHCSSSRSSPTSARRQSRGAAPRGSHCCQNVTRADPALRVTARDTQGQISHQLHGRHGNSTIYYDLAIRWEIRGYYLAIGRREGRRAGQAEAGCAEHRESHLQSSIYITTLSYLGNKDMISSGANFLGALKSVAGKIWSTVITEEDKDRKVAGRAPGPRNTWIPQERLCSSHRLFHKLPLMPEPLLSLLTRKKRGWGGQMWPIPYQSAVLRNSGSMEEKGNLVSMATEVWKKYPEINVILTRTFTCRPTVWSYSTESITRL